MTLGVLPGADVAVAEYYPEWRQGRKADVTLQHLMTHTSGLQNVPAAPEEIYPSPDFVQLALCAELRHAPGTAFSYNNKAVNLICGLLDRATGQRADDFARAELFAPLGIHEWQWDRDRAGTPHGMSGLQLRARDLARLAQLTLRGGEGLITPSWIHASTCPATPATPRMGLLWWTWHPQTTYTVTDAHVQHLREAQASPTQIGALTTLRGTHTRQDFHTLMGTVGFDPTQVPAGTRWLQEDPGPRRGWCHDGWLGQYLVVDAEADLVAVRLIAADQPGVGSAGSSWPEFMDDVFSLAR
ncbi:hypothetical protein GCM10010844_18730 [Deinococcus radiotolerans]|uniref:Beta-lactamase-related domain-containing protein n=1 Tax=Deinococcus radiotolerans TaxID=1309407 RepID=A0ABQ2FI27_9DEIO|nr:hypothetical protein GCM10010844_18730 [Deinococcus radiotolerans]